MDNLIAFNNLISMYLSIIKNTQTKFLVSIKNYIIFTIYNNNIYLFSNK